MNDTQHSAITRKSCDELAIICFLWICYIVDNVTDGKHFEYRNYYDSYFKPLMEQLGINRTPH